MYEPLVYGFEEQEQAIKLRQAMLAEAMRNRVGANEMPQGQMVSGHFVAPSILQHLSAATAPMIRRQAVEYQQRELAKQQAAYAAADRQAAMAHIARRPTGTTVQTPYVHPKMDDEPSIPGLGSLRHVAPTSQQTAAWAQAGTAIPSRRAVMERLLQDQEINEPIREEQRAFRREDREDRQTEATRRETVELAFKQSQLEQRAEEARQRSADTRLGIAERAAAAKRHSELMAELGRGRLDAAAEAAKKGKMTDTARRELDAADATERGLAQAITSLSKASDKGTGWWAGLVSEKAPGGQALVAKNRDKATNDAIQQLTYWTDAIRHERFGAALTVGEKSSASQYLPAEYDSLEDLKRKAAGVQALVNMNHSRLRQQGGQPREGGATGTWEPAARTAPAAAGKKPRVWNPAKGDFE